MKFNEQELDETIQPIKQTDLIYGIEDRPPFKDALFAAVQHLLAIWSDRSGTALYSGYELFIHRSDYFGRTHGRTAFDFRFVYGGRSG